MAKIETIQDEIEKLSIYYRDTRSQLDLGILCKMWHDDLRGISDDALPNACATARKMSRFFPTPADIMEAHRQNIDAEIRNRKALPSPPVEPISLDRMREIRQRNMANVKKIAANIGHKI